MARPIDRLRSDPEVRTAHEVLTSGLSGADLRSLLLDIAAARAADRTPSSLLDQYQTDRFCAPSPIDAVAIARAEADGLACVADRFEPLRLAPLSPLGTSSALSTVPQNNVVTTMRMTEALSDPTNVLALEAALRRRQERDATVRLAASARVTRAQRFGGPRSFAHFSILGLVSAGRDRGDRAFEVEELVRHIEAAADAIGAIRPGVEIVAAVSDHSGRLDEAHAIAEVLNLEATVDADRAHGLGYYEHLCCKIQLRMGDELVEVGDGGSTNWTQQLSTDRKERLVISGLGLDRIVM